MLEIVAVLGNSKAGKDEVAKFINKHYGYKLVHPADGLKNFLSNYYSPYTIVDLHVPENKNTVINEETGATYEDILIAMYNIFYVNPKLDPMFSCRYLSRIIETTPRGHFVIRGIRTIEEAQIILYLITRYEGDLFVINVTREQEEPLPTDSNLPYIKDKLTSKSTTVVDIVNDGTLEELEQKVKKAVSKFNG